MKWSEQPSLQGGRRLAASGFDPLDRAGDAGEGAGGTTLGFRIYASLRERLAAGEYQPGQRLSSRKLAAALGTSLMPVRDALLQLTVERAIELLPTRVFRVPFLSVKRFQELRDIRIRLEGMAAELAAERMAPLAWQRAAELSDRFTAECDAKVPDPSTLIRINKELHFVIYEAAGSEELLRIIETIWTQIGPVLNFDVMGRLSPGSRQSPCDFHQELINALGSRDPRRAKDALEGDIDNTYRFIIDRKMLE